jgi:hypothetical protein
MSTSSSSKPATSAPASAPSHRSGSGGGKGKGYVVAHEAVGFWLKNRVLVAGEDFNAEENTDPSYDLDEHQLARLERLGALRDATGDELSARADAKKAAEDAGEDFQGYAVPEPPPPQTTEATAGGGQVG